MHTLVWPVISWPLLGSHRFTFSQVGRAHQVEAGNNEKRGKREVYAPHHQILLHQTWVKRKVQQFFLATKYEETCVNRTDHSVIRPSYATKSLPDWWGASTTLTSWWSALQRTLAGWLSPSSRWGSWRVSKLFGFGGFRSFSIFTILLEYPRPDMFLLKPCKWVQAVYFVIIKGVRGLLINFNRRCARLAVKSSAMEPVSSLITATRWALPQYLNPMREQENWLTPSGPIFCLALWLLRETPSVSTNQDLTNSQFSREERPERGTHPRSRERKTEKNAKDPQSFVRRIWNEILKKKKNHPIWLP